MKHTKEYYIQNDNYSQHLEKQGTEVFRKYTDFIKRFSKRGDIILDVGCGTGIALHLLKDSGLELYGVDLSEPSCKIARSKGLKNVVTYDGSILPFDEQVVSVVGSFDVLEHVENPDLFLGEQLRVLKSGGHLIIACPNFLSVTNNYHHHTSGLLNKLKNPRSLLIKVLKPDHKFEKMQTINRDVFQSDDDACNITNPVDIKKWANLQGLKLIYWSSCSRYDKGIKSSLDFGFLKYFLGSSFIVFKKTK